MIIFYFFQPPLQQQLCQQQLRLTTTTTTTTIPECPYNIGFESGEILTVNESDKYAKIKVVADPGIECQFKKTLLVKFELKSHTAKQGLDFEKCKSYFNTSIICN